MFRIKDSFSSFMLKWWIISAEACLVFSSQPNKAYLWQVWLLITMMQEPMRPTHTDTQCFYTSSLAGFVPKAHNGLWHLTEKHCESSGLRDWIMPLAMPVGLCMSSLYCADSLTFFSLSCCSPLTCRQACSKLLGPPFRIFKLEGGRKKISYVAMCVHAMSLNYP